MGNFRSRISRLLGQQIPVTQGTLRQGLTPDVPVNVDAVMATLLTGATTDAQVRVLTAMVLDLFVEVEALRGAMRGPTVGEGLGADPSLLAGKSTYQAAYLNAVYLTHNSAGPSSGVEKLLGRFYPTARAATPGTWRECFVLRGLGFSEQEVDRYVEAAAKAERFT